MNVDAAKVIERMAQNFSQTVARLEYEKAVLECKVDELVGQLGGVVQQPAPPAPAFAGGSPAPGDDQREGDAQPAGD